MSAHGLALSNAFPLFLPRSPLIYSAAAALLQTDHLDIMHFFVRDLSGNSLPFGKSGQGIRTLIAPYHHLAVTDSSENRALLRADASDVSTLQYAITDRTAIPVEDQRLVYGSSQLVPGRSLAEYGVVDGSTIGLALRLRGGAPKKRCKFMLNPTDQCSQAAVRIVGDCQLCSLSFCARHRLAEGAWFIPWRIHQQRLCGSADVPRARCPMHRPLLREIVDVPRTGL